LLLLLCRVHYHTVYQLIVQLMCCWVVNGSSVADSDRDIATDAAAAAVVVVATAAAVAATCDDFYFPVTGVVVV